MKKKHIIFLIILCILLVVIISFLYFGTLKFKNQQIPNQNSLQLNQFDRMLQEQDVFDKILQTCPTKIEIEEFVSYFSITSDVILKKYDCVNGMNPNYGENLDPKLTTYHLLRIMKISRFKSKFPWTEKDLYDWFKQNVKGFHINSNAELSFCCKPKQVINLKLDVLQNKDKNKWINSQSGTGMMGLLILAIHEARHVDIIHTCGYKDKNLEEMGAFAVQYYLTMYIATELPENYQSQYARDSALSSSEEIKETRFCDL